MKVYARFKKLHDSNETPIPYNINIANAIYGFHSMGIEIIPYFDFEDAYKQYELGDIVLDGVAQVKKCLEKLGIVIKDIDYPEILNEFLGRRVWIDTFEHVKTNSELWPVFIKPTKDKQFVGRVITDYKDFIGCNISEAKEEILCSETIDLLYEYRVMIYYDNIIDIRPYKGIWKNAKIDTAVLSKTLEKFVTWNKRPNACCLDFGVTKEGNTILVEMNGAFSFGAYGLDSLDYAKMISAYISQISNCKDECYFG